MQSWHCPIYSGILETISSKKVDATAIVFTQKVLISGSFSVAPYKQEMCKSLLQRNENIDI